MSSIRREGWSGGSSIGGILSKSYVHGASSVPLIGETIGAYFDQIAERYADREAALVPFQGIRLTYGALKRRVDAFAAGLLALGLEPGDRVGIWSQNNIEWLITQLATARAGMILVNINPAYRLTELDYALNSVGCKALVTSPSFKSSNYIQMLRLLAPELETASPGRLSASRLPHLRSVIRLGTESSPGMYNFAEVSALASAHERQRLEKLAGELQFDDPINIQFTSGTTGVPKGATLSHHNILNNGFFIGEAQKLSEVDKVCIPVPLYHCFGMVLGNLACITHGSTMVYPSEGFDPLSALRTVQEERCTALYGVPTMFIAELEHPEFFRFDLSSLRTGIMAGAPCPIELMRRVISDMHCSEITIAYGMTETSPVSFQSSTTDSIERRVSTVGQIQPHLEVKIVDSQGKIVPPGVPGELLTRGYSVMLGYWNDPQRTAQCVDSAGWMHTGDLATLDEQGYCAIVGRIKDMVIRGGENIYPREIEEFLYKHPKIGDVQVFGVPDPLYGEELCAWIRVREGQQLTEDDVRAFCKGQIAHYKIPRYVRFVESFPTTVTGKIQKYIMREVMAQELQKVRPA